MKYTSLGSTDKDGNTSRDLPWANEYAKNVQDFDVVYLVVSIVDLDTGLMVLTKGFKGYIYSGTQLHSFLLEAVKVYAQEQSPVPNLLVKINKRGKLEVLRDNEETCGKWLHSEGKYTQVQNDLFKDIPENKENPFLAGMGVRKGRVRGKKADSPGESDVSLEPPTSPNKAP